MRDALKFFAFSIPFGIIAKNLFASWAMFVFVVISTVAVLFAHQYSIKKDREAAAEKPQDKHPANC